MVTTYYTINPFSLNKDIVDVTQIEPDEPFAPMGLAVRVPKGVSIQGKPKTLGELLDAKREGMLAMYDGFSYIVMDSCLNVVGGEGYPGVNTTASKGLVQGSGYDGGPGGATVPGIGNTHHQLLPNGQLKTQAFTLPMAPESAVVHWEVYRTSVLESSSGLLLRHYIEEHHTSVDCEVQFSNAFLIADSGVLMSIPEGARGTNLVLTFTNLRAYPVYLASWAVVF